MSVRIATSIAWLAGAALIMSGGASAVSDARPTVNVSNSVQRLTSTQRADSQLLTWRAPLHIRAQTVSPRFPQAVLQVTASFPPGPLPDKSALLLVNTDDSRKYSQELPLSVDQRLSVPEGHYAMMAVGFYYTEDSSGNVTAVTTRIAFAFDRTVTANGGAAHLDLAAATASGLSPTYSGLPTSTPLRSQATCLYIGDQEHVDAGQGYETEVLPGDDVPETVLVQRVTGAAIGLTDTDQAVYTSDPQEPSTVYDLTRYHHDTLSLGEHVAVRPSDLATIDSTLYHFTATGGGYTDYEPSYPGFDDGEAFPYSLPTSSRTTYLLGPAPVRWAAGFETDTTQGGAIYGFGYPRTFQPDRVYHVAFLRGPLAPGLRNGTMVRPIHAASRTADQLAVGLAPVVDSDPTQFAYVGPDGGPDTAPAASRTQIFRDGTQVFDGTNYDQPVPYLNAGGVPAVVATPSGKHRYRIVVATDLATGGWTQSTRAVSDYRFASSATSEPPVPTATCAAPGSGPCSVLPLLTVQVPVPTDPNGNLPAGAISFDVTVGHLQGALPTAITSLTVETSLDGTHYVPAGVVALGGGRFRVTIVNAAADAGRSVTTRVSAADTNGSSLTQTVTAAYRIGAGS